MLFFNFEYINPTSAWLLTGAFHTKQQRNKIQPDKKSQWVAYSHWSAWCCNAVKNILLRISPIWADDIDSPFLSCSWGELRIHRWRHWLELCRSSHLQPRKTQKWIPNTQEHLIFIIWEFHQLNMTKSQQQCCLNFLKKKQTKNQHSSIPFFDANLNLSNDVRGRTFLTREK